MSAYENVVTGKLKLKGKALDVKTGGVKKKKKNQKQQQDDSSLATTNLTESSSDLAENASDMNDHQSGKSHRGSSYFDALTPAEKRYIEQKERIDVKRLAKTADKSHRDRIEDFNQYLANMSEHYDIPKMPEMETLEGHLWNNGMAHRTKIWEDSLTSLLHLWNLKT